MAIVLLVGLLLIASLGLLLRPASTPAIDARLHRNGIAVLEQVPINGTKQWILVRSEDVANPVVLFVHGGPGTSQLTLNRKNTRSLEKHFTVVNWDQRRAGKSFAAGRDPAGMTIDQFVDDVIDLSSSLAARFHKDKILLVGHSWGSAIGMLAVYKRPDLFSAYVGIGQVSRPAESERLSYEWTLEQARQANDQAAVKKLTQGGPPPYTGANWRARFLTERRIMSRYRGEFYGSKNGGMVVVVKSLLFSREYSLTDRFNYFRGIFQSLDALMPQLFQRDLFVEVPEVKVPVYFCLGRHDYEVPSQLSAQYFEALHAPRKQLVWFENSAHMVNTEERDRFNAFMADTVLPAITQ